MLTAQNHTRTRRYRANLALTLKDKAAACSHLLQERAWRYVVSKAEKAVLRRSKKISPTAWAPIHFKVPYGPYEGRQFSFDITPHLYGMLEAYALPFVNKIAVCAAPQTTKTTFAHIATSWSAKFEPGPAVHLYPNETLSDEVMEERLQKIFELSPQLRNLLTGRKEDKTKRKLRLRTCVIRMAWAGSASAFSSRSYKIGVADETDKYNERPSDTETTTLELLKIRFRTFMQRYMRGAKLLVLSSPSVESGFIWIEITQETEAVFVFWSRCPFCGTEQLMQFGPETFTWPHGEDGHSLDRKIIKSKYMARYICIEPRCKKEWDDDIRLTAQQLSMKNGWRLRTEDGSKGEEMLRYLRRERPQSIGFLVPSWISKFVSLSEVAHDYLKSKDKNLSPEERFAAMQNFRNAHEALPWKIELQAKPVEKIKEFIDDRPEGCPPGRGRTATLLAHVDTQDDCFYLSIWAIGWGFLNEMWLVLRKQVFTKEDIVQALWNSEYIDADGQIHIVEQAGIDFLGHRSKEIIEFCIQYEGLITPTYGSARPMGSLSYAWSQREYIPGTKTAIPGGGIQAMKINTKYHKDGMGAKLAAEKDSPGCIHIYSTAGDDYCKQLVSESPDLNGDWQQIGGRPNHYWDNLVAVSALADWLGIKFRRDESRQEENHDDGVVVAQSDFMARG